MTALPQLSISTDRNVVFSPGYETWWLWCIQANATNYLAVLESEAFSNLFNDPDRKSFALADELFGRISFN